MKEKEIVLFDMKAHLVDLRNSLGKQFGDEAADILFSAFTDKYLPTPKPPLRELAENEEHCKEICRLMDCEFYAADANDEYTEIEMNENMSLFIYYNGMIDWPWMEVPNCLAICQFILEHYSITQ